MTSTPGSSRRADWPLAVVFGAGGLGMAVARRLGLSHRLLIADRNPEHLDRQVQALAEAGYDALGVACDVTRPDDVGGVATSARAAGGASTLVYVVGLSPALGDFRAIMSVNLVGAARALDAFAEVLLPGGAALFIGSSAAHMATVPPDALPLIDAPLEHELLPQLDRLLGDGATPAAAYTLSKQGLIRLCQRHAGELGRRGVRVLSLSPGLIATPQGAGEYRNSPGKIRLFEAIPLGREATMLEIAGIAEFLVSDRASFISGVDILADGGLTAGLGLRRFC